MYTLLGDPFFFRINKLNAKIWENVEFDVEKLKNYVGKQYKVELDSKRLDEKYKLYCKRNYHDTNTTTIEQGQNNKQDQSGLNISTWKVALMIFSAFKGSYTILLLLKFSLMLTMFFLAYSLKKFKESFGVGSEYVKGVSLIVNQIIEILFNIYVDYYAEVLHIRVRGGLTLFLMNLMLRNRRLSGKHRESLFKDTQDFSKIQNVVSVDGEFAEYIVSYGMEIITFPFSLFLLFGISNMFINAKSIYLCMLILVITGVVSIASQWISSSYKKYFMEAREERISCLTKSISQNDDFVLTHINDTLFMNLIKKYRTKEMKFNKCRKLWFCVGEIVAHWMEILCSMTICIYCYYNNFTGSEVMSILTNCSFIIPVLVKPISSIAYMTYYITEAINAVNRIKDILSEFDPHSYIDGTDLYCLTQTTIDDIEQVEIQDLCSGESMVLNKGCLNIVFDCERDDPNQKTLSFFRDIASFSTGEDVCNSKFLLRCKIKGSGNVVSLNCNREIARLACYISKKSWILDNSKLEEMIICDQPFDYHLWNLVINICQLDTDIYNKSINLNDIINSKQISTGQRIRISFARSLYSKLIQSSVCHIRNFEKNRNLNSASPSASSGPLGRNYCVIYLIENIFDALDRETSCRIIYSLFNKDDKLSGVLSSSFGMVSISPNLLNLFFFTVYLKSCKSLIFDDKYGTLLEYNKKCTLRAIGITEDSRIVSHYNVGMKDLISDDPSENEELLKSIIYFVNNNINENLVFKNGVPIDTNLISESSSSNSIKRENKIDIEKDVDNLISLRNGEWISNSLKYYLFQTNDKVRYKFDTKMNKISNIKRNKSLIFVYLLFSTVPLFVFKITEYKIINNLNKTPNLLKDLAKYLYYCLIILVNFVITIFLEIYIGLKSANYIHNTILYGYLTSYSVIKVIPVSSIISHLSNDQLVIDYCITKRIGQILHHVNKVIAFVIISFVINFKDPMTYIPIGFLYMLFIYWNYLSYFINTCRTLRLLFLNCQTAVSDLAHSINLGIDDIHQNQLSTYMMHKCNKKALEMVAPLYCQNMMFAWLRLRLDFLLPVILTSINVLIPIFFPSSGANKREIPQMIIFIIGVGLTIPKITSSTVKYWVKMENELLAVTRMRLLMETLQDDRFGNNLEIDRSISTENSSLLMTLKSVDCRHLKLKDNPFSSVINNYSNLAQYSCLRKVNLEIRVGDVIGVIGRTGSGKTSLLKVIGGIIDIYKGTKTVHRGLLAIGHEDERVEADDDEGTEDIVKGGLLGLEGGLRKEVQERGKYLSIYKGDSVSGNHSGVFYSQYLHSDEEAETKNYKQKEDDYYKMKESSLERIKNITEISEIDPNILLNSVKMLEFLSGIAYVPIKVDFPGNLKLSEVLDSEKICSSLEILDLLDLFGLVDKKKNLLYDQRTQDNGFSPKSYESQPLLLSPLNLQILDLPISSFNFNLNQKRMLLLLRLALNSQKYRLLLLDEIPNYRLTTEDGGYISFIDFILKKYFPNCSVIIATHHFDQISSINRLLVTNNNHKVFELY
ncbi:ABC transporter [Cryptosporidium sp. chipmunk genotype I]|uniref:ABC transporter n=1 Tax=Cryptosporidium sp. chipmunk genotype I TaxID=1280935 RepID=UPI003519E25D|nr:ABC transporter [Cryptosporidium sp. chipmunk genotype I]